MPKKLSLNEFIDKANLKHNNKYYDDKSIYINSKSLIEIGCREHGYFLQKVETHLDGSGCPLCDKTKRLGDKEFIEKSINIHGNIYNYDKVVYGINNYDKVEIICGIHGSFLQRPFNHLQGQGCPKCCNNTKKTTEQFIEECKDVHGDRYDYSLVDYKTKREKVKIICSIHGIFEQKAHVHREGYGCPICRSSKLEKETIKYLNEKNIEYIKEKRFDDCRNKYPLPFDFYLPKYNILIECDGIQHHKSIEHFGGDERLIYQKNNDKIKDEFCIINNILLIRINKIEDLKL